MAVLVTEAGFAPDDWTGGFLSPDDLQAEALPPGDLAVAWPNDRDPAELVPLFDRLAMIRVDFPGMADGRGFSIGRKLRALGFAGRLRAAGPLVADQLRAALRVGYDEIELPDAMAEHQPEAQWRLRKQGSYQDRVRS
jgi:uncharacterized protein (DUF934 family)